MVFRGGVSVEGLQRWPRRKGLGLRWVVAVEGSGKRDVLEDRNGYGHTTGQADGSRASNADITLMRVADAQNTYISEHYCPGIILLQNI